MKSKRITFSLLFLYCLTTSLQCDNCSIRALRLDATKSWLPLKGKTQLSFLDNAGTVSIFRLSVVDTTEIATNDCGEAYQYEYITTALYLNQPVTDSIRFILASGGWMCASAVTGSNPNFSMCNVFGQAKEGTIAQRLNNHRIGNTTYKKVILLRHNPGFSNSIDSVYIANQFGIVGFNYFNTKYSLQ